ncbi:MAG: MaoC family dehydratase [Lachnospiraceae bacterium]|nr:MaoC family dehydratase [Lachnospiraceae bacterium]
MEGLTVFDLHVGQEAFTTKTISETDVYLFAGITGDMNPAHLNEEYAKKTMFGGRIVHGLLSAGLISAVIGMQLPGPGTIYVRQDLKFLAPVKIGDTITARVTVTELNTGKNRVTLETVCENQEGKRIIEGDALVMPRKEGE